MIRYRHDIDGLRALAIIPVVLFHSGFKTLSGGYIGVDVFFVISGFLITSILYRDITEKRFSLLDFYERRARRIFPVLFVMLFTTLIAGFILFRPDELLKLGRLSACSALFVSNVCLYLTAGYFTEGAAKLPLLHTWSLAIEEQYYIVFPVILMVLLRWRRTLLLPAIATLLALSFITSVIGLQVSPSATYYLLPTRMWEMLVGSLLALLPAFVLSPTLRKSMALLGLGLIIAPIFLFTEQTAFPAWNALYPCIGAALIILSGTTQTTSVHQFIGAKPLVFIGKISYSLYIWHWPLLVFANYIFIRDLTLLESLALQLVIWTTAILSWHYIEKPFRISGKGLSQKTILVGSVATIAVTLFMAAAIVEGKGWPQRLDPRSVQMSKVAKDRNNDLLHCAGIKPDSDMKEQPCLVGEANASPQWLLWGDSHAWAFHQAFSDWLANNNQSGLAIYQPGCPPLLEVERRRYFTSCSDFHENLIGFVKARNIKNIMIVSVWTNYLTASLADHKEPDLSDNPSDIVKRSLARTLQALKSEGIQIAIMEPMPQARFDLPSTLSRAYDWNRTVQAAYTRDEYINRNKVVLDALNENNTLIDVRLSPADQLCSTGLCAVTLDGMPLYSDINHVSRTGAQKMSSLWDGLKPLLIHNSQKFSFNRILHD